MTLALKGSNSSIGKSIKHILYKLHLCNNIFTRYSSAHIRRSMERKNAADICKDLITTVQHIWEILDEKDTPRIFNRTELIFYWIIYALNLLPQLRCVELVMFHCISALVVL